MLGRAGTRATSPLELRRILRKVVGLARGHEYPILDDADRARGMGRRVLWLKQHQIQGIVIEAIGSMRQGRDAREILRRK